MARLRRSVPAAPVSGVVPLELLDHGSPVWRDAVLFAAWVARHGSGVDEGLRGEVDWCVRFRAAVDAWAVANDLVDAVSGLPDHRRLAALGIRQCRRLRSDGGIGS